MLSCQCSTMLAAAAQNTCPFLHRFKSHHSRFRCLLDQIAVSPSFTSVLTSDNVIAAAAKAATTSASLHGAVSSAITQVAVTTVAIASGACLSTKVDFLWPKLDEQPESEECIRKVNQIADKYWDLYSSESLEHDLPGHLLRYPIGISGEGNVRELPGFEFFPDTKGRVLGGTAEYLPPILTT